MDAVLFIAAMQEEIYDHEIRNHWSIVKQSTIPSTEKTIQGICSFKQKRFPDRRLNKHKARLCSHGGMQEWGENYWETYIPVANMITVRLLISLCNIHKLEFKSTDLVLDFPQDELEMDIWMELPIGFMINEVEYGHSRSYVIKLNKILYGLKQASLNWYEKL